MNLEVVPDLEQSMTAHGFRTVAEPAETIPGALLLMKRQTWNTNRAVAVIEWPRAPLDLGASLRTVRRKVAFRCGFVPVLWGIGIQVIVAAPGLVEGHDPTRHVARVDNQWAIVQSLFLVDTAAATYRAATSWGQVFTGTFQAALAGAVGRHFTEVEGAAAP